MRIDNSFIRSHFQWDNMSDVKWSMVRDTALAARRVMASPEKFPHADWDYIERQDLECSMFLLQGPIQYII